MIGIVCMTGAMNEFPCASQLSSCNEFDSVIAGEFHFERQQQSMHDTRPFLRHCSFIYMGPDMWRGQSAMHVQGISTNTLRLDRPRARATTLLSKTTSCKLIRFAHPCMWRSSVFRVSVGMLTHHHAPLTQSAYIHVYTHVYLQHSRT